MSGAPPDFIGVGTRGSGTAWWDRLIGEHPEVYRAPEAPQELQFFRRFWDGSFTEADVARYHACFPRPPEESARSGEWTADYMAEFWTPSLLHQAAPNARLLVLLRNPIERFLAETPAELNRKTSQRMTARAAANAAFQRGCYAQQLEHVWSVFPREQVLVLQLERCVREPGPELRRTFDFLDLDPRAADAIDLSVGSGEVPEPSLALSDDRHITLVRAYRPEVERLAALVPELDLALWNGAFR